MTKRIDYLDAAKGIGILFVVLGHNHIKVEFPAVYQVVYSFHMPFFFLLSGMFFRTDYGFMALARRRFNSLLKPFIAYMLIIYIGAIFFTNTGLPTIFGRMLKALYAGPNTLEWVPLWFLPHLFLVNLFAYVLIKFAYDRMSRLWMRGLFLVALLGAGVATIQFFWQVKFSVLDHVYELPGLPWSADLLLITSAFFILGYEIRRTFLDQMTSSPYSAWVWSVSAVLFVSLNIAFQYTIDFYIRSYGSFVVNTLEAVSGSIVILCLAKWLEKASPRVFGRLITLGGISIVLLIFHYIPQAFLYDKLISLNIDMLLASAIAFCAGVLLPVLLFAWVIRPNPLLSGWFGLSRPQEVVDTPPLT
jgi:fucose 4-O-acetylase-like acetyltransferase